MGPSISTMHIGNASSRYIRARVAQDKVQITEMEGELGGSQKAIVNLDAKLKATMQYSLDDKSFARIGPHEALEYDLPRGVKETVYVTIADDACQTFFCYNYSPPRGRSLIFTENGTLIVSQELNPSKMNLSQTIQPTISHAPPIFNNGDAPTSLGASAPPAPSVAASVAAPPKLGGHGALFCAYNSKTPVEAWTGGSVEEYQTGGVGDVVDSGIGEVEGNAESKIVWTTPDGITYTEKMATKIHRFPPEN